MAKKQPNPKNVEAFKHDEATRKNIPTAEYESLVQAREKTPIQVAYERRNRDLDPQLVWRGKDEQDWSDLVVSAAPLYIQEKMHPKVLVDDLLRETREREHAAGQIMPDLFSDFNGIPKGVDKTEFYQHDQNWSNRMILGDSLQVMASLAEREGLRGKVQCIYIDPPYGIKFNSNFQWSTTSRDVKDGNTSHITREPEQVKAFRDTWRDGVHSYLTYLRDRLTVARDLLTESGSIFVQISDENVHRVRLLMDEVFGDDNFVSIISFNKNSGFGANLLATANDFLLWYARSKPAIKYRQLYLTKTPDQGATGLTKVLTSDGRLRSATADERADPTAIEDGELAGTGDITKPGPGSRYDVLFQGKVYRPEPRWWGTTEMGMRSLVRSGRVVKAGKGLAQLRRLRDNPVFPISNVWTDTVGQNQFGGEKIYVVQTALTVVERCVLMTSDPGDLVLDPTCGSGTTATVAEQWARRWITIDTSRVALALVRSRLMGARYPYYILADSRDGQIKEGEVTRTVPSTQPVHGNIRHGFVYERVPHVTLKSIANNAEIEVIWEKWQEKLEPLRESLNAALNVAWQAWEIPREADKAWPRSAARLHTEWWEARVESQQEINKSIAAKAEFEYLYDKPYEDKKTARVAGPFTVESLSPHRVLSVDENDELIDPFDANPREQSAEQTFAQMILENLRMAGVQQAHKDDKIKFTSLTPWPGEMICADGRYIEGDSDSGTERRAAIFIGPEFGTVTRPDLVQSAREAADAGFDLLITCAFSYEAYATEFDRLGGLRVLKARMNADLHMADDLKNTGKGNLFVIFGEPDIDLVKEPEAKIRVKINGVDVFHPNTGEVLSNGPDGIACWFIDTDYNEESFFVRHAYFLGANDPLRVS
jgi:adenine-specific DNA-methyltransferase